MAESFDIVIAAIFGAIIILTGLITLLLKNKGMLLKKITIAVALIGSEVLFYAMLD